MTEEFDDIINDTFVVFDQWSGRIMGIYEEISDAMDRLEEIESQGGQATIEAYTLNEDVDYEDNGTEPDTFAFEEPE